MIVDLADYRFARLHTSRGSALHYAEALAADHVADAGKPIAFARAVELGDRWAELHKPATRGRLEIVRSQPGRPVAS